MSDDPPEKGQFREDEQSDLFSVKGYHSGASIPSIDKVPETKEEIRRRRIARITYAVIAVVTVIVAVLLYLYFSHRAEVLAALEAASDDGRTASIHEALSLIESDSSAEGEAQRLRLRTMLVLAGEEEDSDAIRGALEALGGDNDDVAKERHIGLTYLALAQGNLEASMEHASHIVVHGDNAAEAARARAMAARAVGNVEQALAAARIAVEQRPQAPRHVALFAELTARSGDEAAAIARLEELPEANRTPETRIARARILDRGGEHLDEVVADANAVLEADDATDHERAWARLLLARAAAAQGDRVTARSHLEQAAEVAPPGDELFTLTLVEAALRMGANRFAAEQAERLPSPLSTDAGRRAQLSCELALAEHSLRDAESALRHAPESPRTALARARLFEARGDSAAARPLYEQAAADASLRVPATVRLASMELSHGDAAEAVQRVDPLLREFPNHPDVVPVAVEARLALGQAEPAMELVTPALTAHPEDVRLLGAKAHVQMALERWEDALATFDSALRIESDDADLHADRGRAAQHLLRLEVAREAYDAALALSPSHPQALLGRLQLDVDAFRLADARQILGRLEDGELTGLLAHQLRARLLVMEIAGRSGIRVVRGSLDEHRDDPTLVMALGWLYMQAEQFADAVRTFSRLTGGDEAPIHAVLARALAQVRMRASNPAQAALESLSEGLDEESLDAQVRCDLHAVRARLAWSGDDRTGALREARAAIDADRRCAEAHLVLAEVAADRDEDATDEYTASLDGPHPPSRGLAALAIHVETPDAATCAYASRYHHAAPEGQFSRGIWRVERDCRALRTP
ncbi:MAG: tetratricopeptide repeat protein [Sandaracinaceae bacterium]